MKHALMGTMLGIALLAPIPSFAHVDVSVGLGLGYPPPVYYGPAPQPPVVYAPAPTYYGPPPGYYDQPTVIYQTRPYWQEYDEDREWRHERHDWREDHRWHEHGVDD